MRKSVIFGIVIVCVISLSFMLCTTIFRNEALANDVAALERELVLTRNREESVRQNADELSAERDACVNQINGLKRQLQQKTDDGNDKEEKEIEENVDDKATIDMLNKQIDNLTKERDAAREEAEANYVRNIDMQLDPTITAHSVTLDGENWEYYLYRARPHAANQPLILSLHGSGESGTGLTPVGTNSSLARFVVSEGYEPDCIVLAPQCHGDGWDAASLKTLLDHVVKITQADTSRLSVTGVSMGGFGTWDMLAAYPTLFRSAAPIASTAYDMDGLSQCKANVRALCGTADGYDSTSGVDAIVAGGGKAEMVWVEGAGHSDMCSIYGDEQYNPVPFLLS